MPDPDDVELVRKAILSSTTGDCEWSESASRRMRSDPSLSELTEEGVKILLQEYVAQGGSIYRRTEKRTEYPQDYWYRVVVPVNQFRHGLFVEIILVDEDPGAPAVQIVSVHEQRK
jgi:hypothetical protein